MAVVLANTAASSPRKKLVRALEGFRNALTEKQRRQFDGLLSRAGGKPDEASVMALTVDIDEMNAKKLSRRIGPRLLPFLETIQQFSAVVDTFVSSKPNLAALVWGGVKVTFLILANFAGYFDKLASIFVKISRSSPRYKEYSILYPDSVGLQDALCLYFATVIRMCQKAVHVSQRRGIVQFTAAIFKPYEREFGALEADINQHAQNVSEEISLAWQQQVKDIQNRQEDAERCRLRRTVRKKLCKLDHRIPWKQARQLCLSDTAIWFKQVSQFQEWLAYRGPSFLWCSGTLGTGKTVLSSSVVAYLNSLPGTDVSYFFCQSDDEDSRSARNILGSICRQVLYPFIETSASKDLEKLVHHTETVATDELFDLVRPRLKANSTHFVVLDGLDACSHTEITTLSEILLQIVADKAQQGHDFRFFVTGRPDLEHKIFNKVKWTHQFTLACPEVNDDIARFIDATLEEKRRNRELKLRDCEHFAKIKEVLLAGAQGMFLWAYLLIEDICAQWNDAAILEALHNIPTQLSDLFDRTLRRIKDQGNSSEALEILKWVVGARRALTTSELKDALTIKPGHMSLRDCGLSGDVRRMLGVCGGLICQDEDTETVRLVHHSVRQHLLSTSKDDGLQLFHLHEGELDRELALLCLDYLKFSTFQLLYAGARGENGRAIIPIEMAKGGLGQGFDEGSCADKLAQGLLRVRCVTGFTNKNRVGFCVQDVERKADYCIRNSGETNSQNYGFMQYVRDHGFYHMVSLDPETNAEAWSVFTNCLGAEKCQIKRPWDKLEYQPEKARDGTKYLSLSHFTAHHLAALLWSLEQNHLAIFRHFFHLGEKKFPNFKIHKRHCEMFVKEIMENIFLNRKRDFARVVCLSLGTFHPQGFTSSHWWKYRLLLAVIFDLSDVVESMLEDNPILDLDKLPSWTYGNLKTVGIFIQKPESMAHAAVEITEFPKPQTTLSYLALAIIMQHRKIFQQLLKWYAQSPKALLESLQVGIYYNNHNLSLSIVDKLLTTSPNTSRDTKPNTHIVFCALNRSWEDIALKLLFCGADTSGVDAQGKTLLMHAVQTGSEQLVDDLLKQGVSLYREDNQHQTVFDHLNLLLKQSDGDQGEFSKPAAHVLKKMEQSLKREREIRFLQDRMFFVSY